MPTYAWHAHGLYHTGSVGSGSSPLSSTLVTFPFWEVRGQAILRRLSISGHG